MIKYLKQTAEASGYELRSYKIPIKEKEGEYIILSVFDFSVKNGGIVDAFKYYNDYYLIKTLWQQKKKSKYLR